MSSSDEHILYDFGRRSLSVVRTFGTVCHRLYAPWFVILHFLVRTRLTFYPQGASYARVLAVVVCLSVCLCVCASVTRFSIAFHRSIDEPCTLPQKVAQNENFYPRGTSYARVLAVVVCLCVCMSVCLSVTRRYCIKTTKRRITQTTSRDSPGTLVFWRPHPWNLRSKWHTPLSITTISTTLRS